MMPDITGLILWYRRLRHDRRDATVLAAIADELQKSGVNPSSIQQHISQITLPARGVLGNIAFVIHANF